MEDLKKHINVDILPLDYGGTFPKTSEELIGESLSAIIHIDNYDHIIKKYYIDPITELQ